MSRLSHLSQMSHLVFLPHHVSSRFHSMAKEACNNRVPAIATMTTFGETSFWGIVHLGKRRLGKRPFGETSFGQSSLGKRRWGIVRWGKIVSPIGRIVHYNYKCMTQTGLCHAAEASDACVSVTIPSYCCSRNSSQGRSTRQTNKGRQRTPFLGMYADRERDSETI